METVTTTIVKTPTQRGARKHTCPNCKHTYTTQVQARFCSTSCLYEWDEKVNPNNE